MTNKVRQMRGPGMNKGLKKPRHAKFPNTNAKSPSTGARSSGSRSDYKKGATGSYISTELGHRLWGKD